MVHIISAYVHIISAYAPAEHGLDGIYLFAVVGEIGVSKLLGVQNS